MGFRSDLETLKTLVHNSGENLDENNLQDAQEDALKALDMMQELTPKLVKPKRRTLKDAYIISENTFYEQKFKLWKIKLLFTVSVTFILQSNYFEALRILEILKSLYMDMNVSFLFFICYHNVGMEADMIDSFREIDDYCQTYGDDFRAKVDYSFSCKDNFFFDFLPSGITEKIFSNLEIEDILTCIMVCKKWRYGILNYLVNSLSPSSELPILFLFKLVGTQSNFSKKYTGLVRTIGSYALKRDPAIDLPLIFSSHVNCESLKIQVFAEHTPSLIRLAHLFNSNIFQNIRILDASHFDKYETLMDTLPELESLEELTLSFYILDEYALRQFYENFDFSMDVIELRNLRKLTVHEFEAGGIGTKLLRIESVKHLVLNFTDAATLPYDTRMSLPNVEILDMAFETETTIHSQFMRNYPKLRQVYITCRYTDLNINNDDGLILNDLDYFTLIGDLKPTSGYPLFGNVHSVVFRSGGSDLFVSNVDSVYIITDGNKTNMGLDRIWELCGSLKLLSVNHLGNDIFALRRKLEKQDATFSIDHLVLLYSSETSQSFLNEFVYLVLTNRLVIGKLQLYPDQYLGLKDHIKSLSKKCEVIETTSVYEEQSEFSNRMKWDMHEIDLYASEGEEE